MRLNLKSLNFKLSMGLFLILIGVFQYFALIHFYQLPENIAVADAVFSIFSLYILMFVIPGFRMNYFLPLFLQYFGITLQALLIAVVWLALSQNILMSFFPEKQIYEAFWNQTFVLRGFIAWVIIFDYYLLDFILKKYNQNQKVSEQEQQNLKFQKEGELYKLRQQLQPHFLFNSLNSINALIGMNPEKARKMVQQLSDYLRKNLRKEDGEFVSFEEELKDLNLYLAIEQIRFGDRLIIEEIIQPECSNKKIPPFLLQPLIENAIKHGLYGTIGIVKIEVTALVRQIDEISELQFVVKNPFDAHSANSNGTGFGLNSIKRRLYLLFARNDLLQIQKISEDIEGENQFIVTLKIPLDDKDQNINH